MLQTKTDGLYSAGNTWGDLAIHMDYASSFRERGLITIFDNPIYAGEKLAYPFIPDLLTGYLSKVLPINLSFLLPSLVAIFLALLLLLVFSLRVTQHRVASAMVPFLFFFNGSIAGLFYCIKDYLAESSLISILNTDYAHMGDHNLRFSNVIADYILPQRTFIFGLLVGLLCLVFLWDYWTTKNRKSLLLGILMAALLPLFHTHTFITMSIFLAGLFVFDVRNYKTWLKGFALFLVLVIPQLILLYKDQHNGFVRWQPGWMAGPEGFILFWFKNLGLYIPLFFLAFYKATTKQRVFFLPLVMVFILANLVQFQPHMYDNMKLMLWWFLFLTVLTANYLVKLPKLLGVVVFFLLICTGILTTQRELRLSWRMFDGEDISLANYIKTNTPSGALFLTSDRHNNPVNCLAGRKVYLGFRGWLWTHGITYAEREHNWVEMYKGGLDAKSIIESEKIDYILLEKYKYNELSINEAFFYENYSCVYKTDTFLLFKTS